MDFFWKFLFCDFEGNFNFLRTEIMRENIHVIIRFRPINKRERIEAKQQNINDIPINIENDTNKNIGKIEIKSDKSKQSNKFTFDHVLDQNTTQEESFERVALRVCDDVLQGYNGTIFAYGQTGIII